jgi:recombinational DNA repair protein (RecF pathway)
LRLLVRAELLRERRALRQPQRYLAASHWVELCNFGFPDDRPDPDLFDLVTGGLTMIERCPLAALPQFVLGLELRYLAHLGALPDLERCADCGQQIGAAAYLGAAGGIACRTHAPAPRRAIASKAWTQLRQLAMTPGKRWPELQLGPLQPTAVELPALWLLRALERRSRLRSHVFRPSGRTPGAAHSAMDTDRA